MASKKVVKLKKPAKAKVTPKQLAKQIAKQAKVVAKVYKAYEKEHARLGKLELKQAQQQDKQNALEEAGQIAV